MSKERSVLPWSFALLVLDSGVQHWELETLKEVIQIWFKLQHLSGAPYPQCKLKMNYSSSSFKASQFYHDLPISLCVCKFSE